MRSKPDFGNSVYNVMREQFKQEMIALLKKHDVIISSYPEYDSEEEYSGESVVFQGSGWEVYFNELT